MKRLFSLLALMLAIAMLLSACGTATPAASAQPDAAAPDAATAAEPADAATFSVGVLSEPDSLYPPNSATGAVCYAGVYEPLIKYDYATGELAPRLATDWEYVDDTTVRFHLRDDVKFSDGSDFTAKDVLFTYQKSMAETTQTVSKLSFIDIANCTVEDDYTIVFKYANPTASGLMIMSTVPIFSEAYYTAVGEDAMATKPLGTGPYAITDWQSGYAITYAKNEYYWGDPAGFETMTVRFYSESTTMMIDYETGAIDMALNIPESDVKRVQGGEVADTELFLTPTLENYVFTIWTGCEKTQDLRVRQAIAHAIDTASISEYCLGVLGTKADSVFSSSMQYYTPCDLYSYDPELSKQLLAEAGVSGLTLSCYVQTFPVITNMVEIIQAQLAEVGITLDVQIFDTGTVIPKWLGLENNMVPECDCLIMSQTLSIPDPDYACTGYKQGAGLTILAVTDEIQKCLDDGLYTMDDAARREQYVEAQKLFVSQAHNVPLSGVLNAFVLRTGLTGFSGLDPNGYDYYRVMPK